MLVFFLIHKLQCNASKPFASGGLCVRINLYQSKAPCKVGIAVFWELLFFI